MSTQSLNVKRSPLPEWRFWTDAPSTCCKQAIETWLSFPSSRGMKTKTGVPRIQKKLPHKTKRLCEKVWETYWMSGGCVISLWRVDPTGRRGEGGSKGGAHQFLLLFRGNFPHLRRSTFRMDRALQTVFTDGHILFSWSIMKHWFALGRGIGLDPSISPAGMAGFPLAPPLPRPFALSDGRCPRAENLN